MTIEDGDLFARFGIERDKITVKRVHRKLFEPRKDGTLSVQNIDGLDYSEIKEAGKRIAEINQKQLYGWAKITRALVENVKLVLLIDNDPCPGHATISGWPEERHLRLDKQQFLATNCCKAIL